MTENQQKMLNELNLQTNQTETPNEVKPEDIVSSQLTEAQLKNAKIGEKPMNAQEQASVTFGTFWPRFKYAITKLNRNSLERIILGLVGHPLEDVKVNVKRKDEQEVYALGNRLIWSNMILMQTTLLDELNKQEAEKTSEVKPEETKLENTGENNGQT